MMLFTFGPRAVQRLVSGWIVLSLVALSNALVFGQEAKAPSAPPAAAEKKPVVLKTDPPLVAKYDMLPYQDLKRDTGEVFKVLSAGEIEKGKEAQFDRYFREYSLGRWTLPANQASLPNFRKELRNYLGMTFQKGPKVHTQLNRILLEQMPKIAAGNHAPVVRVNATLMLGDLNSQESPTKPAAIVPLAAAVEPLAKLFTDEKQLESVRVAALEGLRRHAESGIADGDTRTVLVAALVKLISSPTPPDRLPSGYDWMRGQASDVLGAIGQPGEKGEVAIALSQVVANSKATAGTRRAAARALGRLDYAKAGSLNVSPIAVALAQLTVDACQRAKRDIEASTVSSANVNRQLRSVVNATKIGLSGFDDKHKGVVGAAKDDAQKKVATTAGDSVNKLATGLDVRDPEKEKEKISTAIETAITALTPLVETK
jgi:hypothetical protein